VGEEGVVLTPQPLLPEERESASRHPGDEDARKKIRADNRR
jgi:hypothetical protein